MSKHTPGPWEIEEDSADYSSGGRWFVVGPAEVYYPYNDSAKEKEATANARLIAKAPEMLGMLQNIICNLDSGEFEIVYESGQNANLDHVRTLLAEINGGGRIL